MMWTACAVQSYSSLQTALKKEYSPHNLQPHPGSIQQGSLFVLFLLSPGFCCSKPQIQTPTQWSDVALWSPRFPSSLLECRVPHPPQYPHIDHETFFIYLYFLCLLLNCQKGKHTAKASHRAAKWGSGEACLCINLPVQRHRLNINQTLEPRGHL